MRERAYRAGRFSDDPRSKSIPSPVSSVTSKSSSAKRRGHKPSSTVNDVEQEMRSARDGVTNLEVAKKSAAFTGGVSFSTNDLDHFIVIVIGTPSETVTFDKDGGLLKSPIIHPFFSVRVPKLALEESQTSTFKAVQMRKELMESIQHFDSQLTEINECSNIYELDLGNKPFERPVTITLPLPQWYTRMIERLQAPPQSTDLGRLELTDDTELQTSTVGFSVSQLHENTSKPTEIESGKKSIQMNLNNEIPFEERPKNLILLYQVCDRKYIILIKNALHRLHLRCVLVYLDIIYLNVIKGDVFGRLTLKVIKYEEILHNQGHIYHLIIFRFDLARLLRKYD